MHLEQFDKTSAGDVLAEILGEVTKTNLAASCASNVGERHGIGGAAAHPIRRTRQENSGVISEARHDHRFNSLNNIVASSGIAG
jgi:hypothetical protein